MSDVERAILALERIATAMEKQNEGSQKLDDFIMGVSTAIQQLEARAQAQWEKQQEALAEVASKLN